MPAAKRQQVVVVAQRPLGAGDTKGQVGAAQRGEELRHQLNHAQKMEAIGKLSGGIANDFNNMLVPIIGYSDMLLHEPNFDGGLRDAAKEIKRAAESAASLTRQLSNHLTGSLYVLDEPSVGLHPADGELISRAMRELTDHGKP